ncbi:MerR family transcriptional regulator [Breznakiella homolactica]|uniref:MerR family transcriptional regulator n=1 Tax=Breznakiella homolactica TaxID=2798577 RepID=A0A7T7XK70_9SPIR|nr:MerR family transcriptional regulator [Breznakiella homolactica]QQO07886.1 MerR family transcriptional regulator [Breznakiella homolactica]
MVKKTLRISEFAALSGISRDNLLFFDKIGLLPPAGTDRANGYRYYSYRQIDTASVINALREIGMPLKEIKAYLAARTPEKLETTFLGQRERLEAQIAGLKKIQDIIDVRLALARESRTADTARPVLVRQEKEALFFGPPLPASYNLAEGWDFLPDFYRACLKAGIPMGFPVGTLVSRKALARGEWHRPSRYFYRLPRGRYSANGTKPAGLYLIGYARTDYAFTGDLYKKLFSVMKKRELRPAGNAYEEFMLDEISVPDPAEYLLRISIRVEEK